MRYPLANWLVAPKGYHYGNATFYGGKHVGLDIVVPIGTPIYAPENGKIIKSWYGRDGGLTLWYRGDSGVVYRFLHCHTISEESDTKILENEIIGKTGWSGRLAGDAPHLHFDISKKYLDLKNLANFIDPEKFFAEHILPAAPEKIATHIEISIGEKTESGYASGGCSAMEPYQITFRPNENLKNNTDVLLHEVLHALFFKYGLGDIHTIEQTKKISLGQLNNAEALQYFLENKNGRSI